MSYSMLLTQALIWIPCSILAILSSIVAIGVVVYWMSLGKYE